MYNWLCLYYSAYYNMFYFALPASFPQSEVLGPYFRVRLLSAHQR